MRRCSSVAREPGEYDVDAGERIRRRDGGVGEEAEQGSPSHGRADMGAALAYVVVRINAAANAWTGTILARVS